MARASALCGFALALAFAATGFAESYKPPHNSLGQPDLEGVWSYNSLTRLERADIYSGVVISEAEARAIKPPPLIAPDPTGQDESETYDTDGVGLARVRGEIRTAWIVDPPDGRLPFTAEGRARAQRPNGFEGPESRSNQERCLLFPNVGPPIATAVYNNHLQILQTREHVVISMEMNHEARIVPLTTGAHGRLHRWMGDSVGWWEGDSLVVETTGITPAQGQRTSPAGRLYLSPDAVVTERFLRISPTQVLYSYTVEDPANYTRPWRGEMPLTTAAGRMFEFACHEGNYSLPNILAGARVEEQAAAAGGSEVAAQTRAAASQPVRQIDHIMIRTGSPQELYRFFTETLELPVAWSMTSPRAGVATGGVGFGNVNVEAIHFPGQTDGRPRLVGFAIEPSGLESSLSELSRRGIAVGERRPLVAVGPDGSKRTLWTNVTLSEFSDADSPANATLHIFLSEYSRSYLNVEERRLRLQRQLAERNGGPLGVLEVKEVIVGAADLQKARRLWQRLLDPARPAMSNTWQAGNGPAIRLVSSAEDRLQTVVVRVASLDRAREFLRGKQLLGAESDGQIAIDPAKVGGLDIRLVGR